jgi:two-component system, cell cycle response regulator
MPADESTRIRPPPPPSAPVRTDFCLIFVAGDALLGTRLPLDSDVFLGRDPSCALPLLADDVSRRHAFVARDGDGHAIHDLGSTNGTFVNGARLETARVRRLAPGDRIAIGPFVARYLRAGDSEDDELARLAELARRDALTGLPNRRAFEESVAREVARARRAGAPLSAAILDVDHFKRVNDLHGHAAGDAVLAAIAARARAAVRA